MAKDMSKREHTQRLAELEWTTFCWPQGCDPESVNYREILNHAKERGYRPGWAKGRYRVQYGEWPPR